MGLRLPLINNYFLIFSTFLGSRLYFNYYDGLHNLNLDKITGYESVFGHLATKNNCNIQRTLSRTSYSHTELSPITSFPEWVAKISLFTYNTYSLVSHFSHSLKSYKFYYQTHVCYQDTTSSLSYLVELCILLSSITLALITHMNLLSHLQIIL